MPKKFKTKEEASRYSAVHIWIRYHYGKANTCEKCGNPNNYKCEWANISGEYKRDRNDFMQLCQRCHKLQDHGDYCRNGHKYTPDNLVKRSDGFRQCKTCLKEKTKRLRELKKNKL